MVLQNWTHNLQVCLYNLAQMTFHGTKVQKAYQSAHKIHNSRTDKLYHRPEKCNLTVNFALDLWRAESYYFQICLILCKILNLVQTLIIFFCLFPSMDSGLGKVIEIGMYM